jgi:hypothetical protein
MTLNFSRKTLHHEVMILIICSQEADMTLALCPVLKRASSVTSTPEVRVEPYTTCLRVGISEWCSTYMKTGLRSEISVKLKR